MILPGGFRFLNRRLTLGEGFFEKLEESFCDRENFCCRPSVVFRLDEAELEQKLKFELPGIALNFSFSLFKEDEIRLLFFC